MTQMVQPSQLLLGSEGDMLVAPMLLSGASVEDIAGAVVAGACWLQRFQELAKKDVWRAMRLWTAPRDACTLV
mgnify:CR=1 FL=1